MTSTIVPMIETSNNELVVSSEQIAIGAGVEHRATLQLIKTNQAELEEFGQVAFEMRAGYNNAQVRIALLNEPQAMLLMTFQRNTAQVKAFKVALIKAFLVMRGVFSIPAVQSTLFDMETKGFTFGQPTRELPATASRHWEDPRTTRNDQIAQIARNAKGAWVPFTIDGFHEKQYKELANAIKYGKRASFPHRGHWEAVARGNEIFIRHTPPAIKSIRPYSEA